MSDASRKRALRYATSRIKRTDDMQHASFFERGYALLLLSREHLLEEVQGQLVRHADLKKETWIDDHGLRDVALMLLALYTYDSRLMSGLYAAHFAKKMIASELHPGGPYMSEGVLDVETNAVIAQLFEALGTPLRSTVQFLRSRSQLSLANGHPSSFLLWPQTIYATEGEKKTYSVTSLSLDDCLSLIARGSIVSDEYVMSLCAAGKEYWQFSGCSSWFSAVLLRGLLGSTQTSKKSERSVPLPLYRVVKRIDQRLSLLAEPARTTAVDLKTMILEVDSRHEITQFAFDFARSLIDHPHQVTDEMCAILGEANFYFWMSYTIYDDFIDDEGKPSQLSIANIAQRDSLRLYESVLGERPLLGKTIADYFDKVDEANAWELEWCRMAMNQDEIILTTLPRYHDKMILAQRSMGHVLGPLLVAGQQLGPDNSKMASLCEGLKHYLIARQLNDDLYDWEKDLRQGHMSYIVTYLLSTLKLASGVYKVSVLCDRIRAILWDEQLVVLCDEVDGHCVSARQFMKESGFIQETGVFYDYLSYIESSVLKSRTRHSEQRDFLASYGNVST